MEIDYAELRDEVTAEWVKCDFSETQYAMMVAVYRLSLNRDRVFTPRVQQCDFVSLTGLEKAAVSRVLDGLRKANILEEREGCYSFCFPARGWSARLRTRIREDSVWLSVESDLFSEAEQSSLPEPVGPVPDLSDGLRAVASSTAKGALPHPEVGVHGSVDGSSALRSSVGSETSGRAAPTGVDESSTAPGARAGTSHPARKVDESSTGHDGAIFKPKIVVPTGVDESSTSKLSSFGVHGVRAKLSPVDDSSTGARTFKERLRRILEGDPDFTEPGIRAAWEKFFELEAEGMAKALVLRYEANKERIDRPGAYLSSIAIKRGRWPREAFRLLRRPV
jgi:hypothetical protein